MKKMLMLASMLLVSVPTFGSDSADPKPEADQHRSPFFLTQDIPLKKGFLEKCLLAGKSLGAATVGSVFGYCCYLNATHDTQFTPKESKLFDRVSSLCLAGAAFVCAAKLGSYSVKSAKEILVDE